MSLNRMEELHKLLYYCNKYFLPISRLIECRFFKQADKKSACWLLADVTLIVLKYKDIFVLDLNHMRQSFKCVS